MTEPKPKYILRRDRDSNTKTLAPVRPNVGIEQDYRRRILALVDEMANSVRYWLEASYKRNTPAVAELAMDLSPAAELQAAVEKLIRRWERRFDDAAPELAKYFAEAVTKRSDAALRSILKRAGFTVQFKMTAAMRDIFRATVEENVQLIKSIPEQYLTQVQGSVMRSVQTGRDLGTLAKELENHYGVTRRRAAFISRDQNNKATGALQRARQIEVGITTATWLHSMGGKKPRVSHVRNSGKLYDVSKGWFDPEVKKFILPGELPNCRCVSKSIVKGFS